MPLRNTPMSELYPTKADVKNYMCLCYLSCFVSCK